MNRRPTASDRGSGGLWVLWGVTAVVCTALVALSLAAVLAARQRAESAADLAALAAARTAMQGGDGCLRAGAVAAAGGATLTGCAVRPDAVADVLVEVPVTTPWLRRLDLPPARARARAGPA